MRPRLRSSVPRINAAPRFRAGGPARGRGRPGPSRQPWIFGPSRLAPEPYVFTTPVEPDGAGVGAAEPAAPPPDAAADAPADASADGLPEPGAGSDGPGGDGTPADQEDYDKRRPPKRDPSARGIVGVSAKLTWTPCLLTHYRIPPLSRGAKQDAAFPPGSVPLGGGVYIVYGDDRVPIYVGETDSFRVRWNARLLEAYQAGVIDTTLNKPVLVWFGVFAQPVTREARRTVEAAIIRVLINGQVGEKLRQGTSFNEFRPGTPIDLEHVLPPNIKLPGFRKGLRADARAAVQQVMSDNWLRVAANSVFEAEFYELAPAS